MPINDYALGNYQSETFANTFHDADTFKSKFQASPLAGIVPTALDGDALEIIFYLLYARYGNSHFATLDPHQAEFQIFAAVAKYGPTWIRQYNMQSELVDLDEDELLDGAKTIYNHAYNPGTEPTTAELDAIDDQNTTHQLRSKLDAYEYLSSLLDDRLTDRFLEKFRNIFLKFVEPTGPIWYPSED